MESVMRNYAALRWRRFDVEHAVTYRAGAPCASLGQLLVALGVLLRFRVRHPAGLVHVHLSHRGSFLREGLVLLVSRASGARTFATVHGGHFADFASTRPRTARAVLRLPRRVGVLTCATRDAVQDLLPGAEVVLVPNPVPPPPPSPVPEEPVVLFAGNVSRAKGVDVLLRAWQQVLRRVPEARLELVGPAADLAVDATESVRVLGPQPPEQVQARLSACRVAVLPSLVEQMPMFVLEAAAAGRPVAATDVAAVRDLVARPELLVPPGDAGALAERLVHLLTDHEACRREGEANRERILEQYGTGAVEQRLLELYDGAL
jgi:glycosyltransferase involved in cell wall biosynthesis